MPEQKGFCVWFTGLSGSGKTTTAAELRRLLEALGRTVTVLDGDVIRQNLSQGLGFERRDRDINVHRIGFVANEVGRHGGVAICAAISPYKEARAKVREMIGGGFVEVFVNTPLAVCEQRDVKGLYALARRGELKAFTGLDDPYEPPENAEIEIDTVNVNAATNAIRILDWLGENGFLAKGRGITPRGYCE
jgi:sulfate adenylyltransferase